MKFDQYYHNKKKRVIHYLYHSPLIPLPQAPPPSPLLNVLLFRPVWLFSHNQNILFDTIKQISSKSKENMQDGAIVHLTEDGMQKHKVPDDHMMPCTHTSTFQRRWTYFWQ